jgi:glutaredoxin 3
MNRVLIYTKRRCPFSEEALFFLDEKGIPYHEVDITNDPERLAEMIEAAGGEETTPQIFIDGEHVGGYEDLVEEDRQGRLAATLASGLEQPGAP